MKTNEIMVAITSVLLVLLLTLHLADDVVRGYEKGGLEMLNAVPFVVLWLIGALVLTGRRSGYIITLIFSLLSIGIPVIHMRGKGLGLSTRIAHTAGGMFFVWTLIAVAVIGLFAVVLSVRGLWSLRRQRPA